MNKPVAETRIYPACCTSACCGRIECTGCPRLPILDEFKAWRQATGATQPDPIWCPSVWTGPRSPRPNKD